MTGSQFIAALCIIGAIILAYNGMDGWGWLIFAAIMIA